MVDILVFGAGIERGFWDFRGGWVQRLQEDLDRYSWNNNASYTVYNLGVPDNTSQDLRDRIKNEIMARESSEDVYVLLKVSGGNDAQYHMEKEQNRVLVQQYRQNISSIVDLAQKHANKEVIIGDTPVDYSRLDPIPWKETHQYRKGDLQEYRNERVEMTKDRGLDLIELRPYIDEENWRQNKLRDGVHPNAEGHQQIYKIVKDGLKERDMIPDDA